MADLEDGSASPSAARGSRSTTATASRNASADSKPRVAARPRKPPPHIHSKASAGKIILIGLLGLAMLFGMGYAAGQAVRGTSADGSARDCEIVETVPTYPTPDTIPVLVLNGGSAPGSATTTSQELGAFGFPITGIDDGVSDATTPVVIQHGPQAKLAVQTLAAYMRDPVTFQEFPDAGSNVTLLLREGFTGVNSAEEAQAILTTPITTAIGSECTEEDIALAQQG
jgi:hypothetical protein